MNFFMTKPLYSVESQAYFPSGHFAGKQGKAGTALNGRASASNSSNLYITKEDLVVVFCNKFKAEILKA